VRCEACSIVLELGESDRRRLREGSRFVARAAADRPLEVTEQRLELVGWWRRRYGEEELEELAGVLWR
jgi:hypothetical protein